MANPFDQFDGQPDANPFDQFDAPQAQTGDLGDAIKRGLLRAQQAGRTFIAEDVIRREDQKNMDFGDIFESKIPKPRSDSIADSISNVIANPLEFISAVPRAGYDYLTSRPSYQNLFPQTTGAAELQKVGDIGKEISAIPKVPGLQAVDALPDDAGVVDTVEAMFKGGLGSGAEAIAGLGAESLPQLLAGATAMAATKNPAVAASVMGLGSGLTERFNEPANYFAKKGFDLSNPEDAQRVLADPDLLKEAQDRGFTRGTIIGLIDALSGGIAAKPIFKGVGRNLAAQTFGAQPFFGAGGEFLATKVVGDEINWKDITLEALGELAGAPIEVATLSPQLKQAIFDKKGTPEVTPEDVAVEAEAGNPEAVEVLKNMGVTEEQLATMPPDRQTELANRVNTIREEEALKQQMPLQEGAVDTRGGRSQFLRDQDRLANEQDAIDTGEIDPAFASTAGRTPRQEVSDPIPVDSKGVANTGDAGLKAAVERAPDPMQEVQDAFNKADIMRRRGEEYSEIRGEKEAEFASDEHMTQLEKRIGENPSNLVNEQLDVDAETFNGMTPNAREQLVAAAQKKRSDTAPGQTLNVEGSPAQNEGFKRPGEDETFSPIADPMQRGQRKGYSTEESRIAPRSNTRGEGPEDQTSAGGGERPFKGFDDSVPENQQQEFVNRAEQKAEAERQRAEEKLQNEWDRRKREEKSRQEQNNRARNRTNNRYDEGQFTTDPGDPDPQGFYSVNDDGIMTDSDGRPVRFKDSKVAAKWAAKNKQGGYFDRVVAGTNTEEVYLRARDNYFSDKDSRQEQATQGDARREEQSQPGNQRLLDGNVSNDENVETSESADTQEETSTRNEEPAPPKNEDDFDIANDPFFKAQDKLNTQRQATRKDEVKEAQKSETESRKPVQKNTIEQDTVVLNDGEEINVEYAIVEASDLVASQTDQGQINTAYPQEFQPRDRSRNASQRQVDDISKNLNPRLLDKSAKASDGAMIITDEGVVISGNGRTLAVRKAYADGNADEYSKFLESKGYPVGDKVEPVLVRVYKGDPSKLTELSRRANERDTMAMSSTEQAMADADAMSDQVVELYRGGDIDSAQNAQFRRRFIKDVVGDNDASSMQGDDGSFTQDGIRRIQSALLGKAFGDSDIVQSLTESSDSSIKAIGGAMTDVSGSWAQMRKDIEQGSIDKDFDVTPELLEAAKIVQQARRENRNVAEYVNQGDIFSGSAISPVTKKFLNLMFRDNENYSGNSHIGRDKVADSLRFYADEVRKQSAGPGLFGDDISVTPEDILTKAKEKQSGAKKETDDIFRRQENEGSKQRDTENGKQGEGSTGSESSSETSQGNLKTKLYGFPGPLFDKDVYKSIGNDLKNILKSTTALTQKVSKPIREVVGRAFYASDQYMRSDFKDRKLLTPTVKKVLDMFHAEAGRKDATSETFFQSVERRVGEQYSALDDAIGKFADDKNAMAQIVKLLRGNPRNLKSGTAIHDAALAVRKILNEHLTYLRDSGVDIGEVKNGYFPREMDSNAILKDPGKFLEAAEKAYREIGLNRQDAKESARALHDEILYGHLKGGGFGANANFVKQRVFGKSVDNENHPLNQFLIDDHVTSLSQYLNRSARRAEIASRFGDNFSNVKELEDSIKEEGAGEAIPDLNDHIQQMTGTGNIGAGASGARYSQNIRMWSALMYLERATLSSLGEIVMPGLRTGNLADSFRSIFQTAIAFSKKNKSEARNMAEDLGLITGHLGESIMSARYAGEDIAGTNQSKILDRYFRRIGLEQFTEATRIASTKIGNTFMRRLVKDIVGNSSRAKVSTDLLAELGIPRDKVQEFSKWMDSSKDGFPTDLDSDMGSLYKKSIWRFVDQTIMRPNKSYKPKFANHPLGSVVYHLQAFTMTFYQNVMKRSGRMTKRALTEKGLSAVDRARLMTPALMLPVLYGFQAAISELRDELTMDKERRDKETQSTKALKWASRSGMFGAADPIVNMVQASSRYNRSATDSFTGPGLGAISKGIDAGLAVSMKNSDKTNTAERKAVRAFYDSILEPLFNLFISKKVGPASGLATKAFAAGATQLIGSGKSRERFLTKTAGAYGEKNKTSGGRKPRTKTRERTTLRQGR